MTAGANWGRETVQLVEIDQPFCAREYGDAYVSPSGGCQAILGTTGERKCYNTRGSCQDPTNYSPGTLTLRFCRSQPGLLRYYDNCIPSVSAIGTAPASINLGGMDTKQSALGQREVVTITFDDHKFADVQVDKYRLSRGSTATAANYLSLPGTSGNYASTPDSAALDVVGDLDVRAKVAATDWTPAAVNTILNKFVASGNQRSYRLVIDASGNLSLRWTTDGITTVTRTSTVPVGAADTSPLAVRATLDVDNGAAGHDVRFYVSDDEGTSWRQLGATVTTAGVTSIFSGSAALEIGSTEVGTSALFNGKIYWAEVRSGIAGSVVARFDAADSGVDNDTSFVSSTTGETWTITGASASIDFTDTFDPYERGTFWGKWLARNPYYPNYILRVREGYVGDSLASMRTRTYCIDRIDGPNNGVVKLTAKDLFVKIGRQKAVAPKASRGALVADLAGSPTPTSFTVTPSDYVEVDYPGDAGSPSNELYVSIGDEILRVSRSGANFTILARGALNTTVADHNQEDAVQYVLRYVSQLAHNIVYDLLCNYTGLGTSASPDGSDFINKADWNTAAAQLTELYTGTIAKPTAVQDLVGELSEQAGFTVWPDVATGMIEFKALRAGTSAATLDDNSYLVEGTVTLRQQVDQRVSEVWVYYAQLDPTVELAEKTNYRSRLVVADLAAEGEQQYGAPSVREVFSRWIPQFGRATANLTGQRLLAMFLDPPTQAQFNLHNDRADIVSLAGYVTLSTASIQDESGDVLDVQHAITEIEYGESELSLKTQSVVFAGSSGSPTGEIVVFIENDDYNLNLRTIYDSLYDAPAGGSPGEVVRFILDSGVRIGSTSTSTPAVTTGTWPSGVTLTLENRGLIQGMGGVGGNGASYGPVAATAGLVGGTALSVSRALILDNSNGQIWGGGGGGGGGGSSSLFGGTFGGGGGGGGAGINVGGGGSYGTGSNSTLNAVNGDDGTAAAGGAGGATSGGVLGHGGAGGAPGVAGSAGENGTVLNGAAGGAAGKYIDGITFVTVGSPTGDLRGNVA